MFLSELFGHTETHTIIEDIGLFESAKFVWTRKNEKIMKKFKGKPINRSGMMNDMPDQCSDLPDMKKRILIKKRKTANGKR